MVEQGGRGKGKKRSNLKSVARFSRYEVGRKPFLPLNLPPPGGGEADVGRTEFNYEKTARTLVSLPLRNNKLPPASRYFRKDRGRRI